MIWYDFGPIRTSGSIVSTLTLHSLTETLKGPGSFDEQHKFSITGANVILTSLNQREDYNSWTVPNHLKMQGVYRTQVSLGSDLWVRLWVTIVTEWVTFLKIQLMWLWLMEIPSQYYNVNRTIQGNVTMHMTHSVNLHSWKNTAVTRGHFSAWVEHRTESRIPLLRGFLCGCCGCFWSQRCILV